MSDFAILAGPMKKNLLSLGVKTVFRIGVLYIFVNAAGRKTEQKTFKAHRRSRFIYRLVDKPLFVELNVAERYAENSFDNHFAGLDSSPDLFGKQTNLLQ